MKDRVMEDVRAMAGGDETALERIIDRYLPLVKGVAAKVLSPTGQTEQISECVNDIFFSVWKNIGKFSGKEEMDFRKWLCAVAKYRAIDCYRQGAKERERRAHTLAPAKNEDGSEFEKTPPELTAGSAEEEALRREELKELEGLMNLLSPEDREIFIMKFFWGMKTEEISRRMGLSRTAVDNRISRGRKRLASGRKREFKGGAGR